MKLDWKFWSLVVVILLATFGGFKAYGRLEGDVVSNAKTGDRNTEDIRCVTQTQQMVIEKNHSAQAIMNEKIYEFMLEFKENDNGG